MVWHAWGKTDRGESVIHPLSHHCMDVAAVFLQMIELPVIRKRLNVTANCQLSHVQFQRLAVLVFLHDIGKLHPGFQAKGWSKKSYSGPKRSHTCEGWSFLMLACENPEHPFHETVQQIIQWCGTHETASHLFAAILAHHGRPVEPPNCPTQRQWNVTSSVGYDWRHETRVMDRMLHSWFEEAFHESSIALPDMPPFQHYLAGLVALADWIGSDTRFFKYSDTICGDYNKTALENATSALMKIGFDSRELIEQATTDFTRLTGFTSPNAAQSDVGSLGPEGNLVILEAETGSGKTEAALWRFMQLFTAGKVSGLYFAVPTRAAAGQLHARITQMMVQAFNDKPPEAVLAIPGMLQAGEHSGKLLPGWKVLWEDEEGNNTGRWAAEHATRFLAAMVAVGTIDQVMLSGLRVKHAHMRGSALSRSFLVIDEVHASDTYMTKIQDNLLQAHLETGGFAMLMSATLGSRARTKWLGEAPQKLSTACDAPYPAVWIKGETKPKKTDLNGRSKTVQIHLVGTMDPSVAAAQAVDAARHGARVLVIRNTVNYAVKTWQSVQETHDGFMLMQAGGGPALHHSRFAAEDRRLLDTAVEEALAGYSARVKSGCIIIGTQTLEQSLDIDADFLVTDLCPIDVLLQRIGRLHRHILPRHDRFSIPRVSVMVPEGGLDQFATEQDKFENGIGVWRSNGGVNGIYLDLAGLELTTRLIADFQEWQIPDMNRKLVEYATHPDCTSKLIREKGDAWSEYDRKVGGSKLAAGMIADLNILDRKKDFMDLNFPSKDDKVMTRLGEEGVILKFDPPEIGPFGCDISRIAIPAQLSTGIVSDSPLSIDRCGDALHLTAGERCFRYSRLGLFPE